MDYFYDFECDLNLHKICKWRRVRYNFIRIVA